MDKKRQAKPKLKEGDRVIEVNKPSLVIDSKATAAHFRRQDRDVGVIKKIIVKKNKKGVGHFYYSVFWHGTRTESTHSSMRLRLVEEE
jgi:hypothetical protein|tara:strand:- start:55256 stop:55519 length:264 start_codon:yes stop_codon:yes gene_type:complete